MNSLVLVHDLLVCFGGEGPLRPSSKAFEPQETQ